MLNFELLYKDVEKLNTSNVERIFAKNNLKNTAFTSFKSYNNKNHEFEN